MPRQIIGTYTATPTAGTTVSVPNGYDYAYLTPAGTLATLTVALPPGPVHNQYFSLLSSQAVTTLTMSVTSPQTLVGGATALTANTLGGRWRYFAPTMTWNPA